jgi:hypothetical protein
LQNKLDSWEDQSAAVIKEGLGYNVYQNNVSVLEQPAADLYDDSREDQVDDLQNFLNVTQNVLTNGVYEKYKDFFYRYQDYNQINR